MEFVIEHRTSNMRARRSPCPISASLDIFGDKWTLVILRDFFAGKRLYKEFLDSPEKISTNILASRLKALEANGLIVQGKKDKGTGKASYQLSKKGKSLYGVLDAIANWGLANIKGTKKFIDVPPL